MGLSELFRQNIASLSRSKDRLVSIQLGFTRFQPSNQALSFLHYYQKKEGGPVDGNSRIALKMRLFPFTDKNTGKHSSTRKSYS